VSAGVASPSFVRILAVVRRIPRGRVATYGQVAALAGFPRQPRLAGYALRHADDAVPWHRVVNAGGRISARADSELARVQRILLMREGIRFNAGGALDLTRYGWRPRRLVTSPQRSTAA
jgi:methylated-DNA-protein-cysteine methyltransferase-like protein